MNIKIIYTPLVLIILALVIPSRAAAQTRPLAILEAPVDARAAAMGGASLMSTDRSYLYVNPTSIFAQDDKKWTISSTGLLYPKYDGLDGRLYNTSISGGWKFLSRHAGYVGFRYQGGLTYEYITDQFGSVGKKVSPFDWTIDLGYAFRIDKRFSVFATASLVQSYSGRGAYGASFGLGGNFTTPISLGQNTALLNLALRISDMGAPIYYSTKDGYAMPTKIEFASDLQKEFNDLHSMALVVGTGYYFGSKGMALAFGNIGAEYTFRKMISLRTGYRFAGHNSGYFSAGLGGQYKGIKLDFAHLRGGKESFSNRSMLTVSYDF